MSEAEQRQKAAPGVNARSTIQAQRPAMSFEAPPSPERRALPRRRTLQRGRVCYGAGFAMSFDCTIRNVTEAGAMLRAATNQAIPDHFALLHVGEGVAYDAKLLWRRGEDAGVTFHGRHDLHGPVDEAYQGLRRVWVALAPS